MKTYRYMDRNIYPCEWAQGHHKGRWFVSVYHFPTGIPYADEFCPHFQTLDAAREYIRDLERLAGVTA